MTIDPPTVERQAVAILLILGSFTAFLASKSADRFHDGFLLMAMTLALVAAVAASPISFVFPSL